MSETPIYDQVARERAAHDPEGLALVRAIHERRAAAYVMENKPGLSVHTLRESPRIGFREVLFRGWWR